MNCKCLNQLLSNIGQNWPSEAMQLEPSSPMRPNPNSVIREYKNVWILLFWFSTYKTWTFQKFYMLPKTIEWPKSDLVQFWPKLAIWSHAVRAKFRLWDLNPIVSRNLDFGFLPMKVWLFKNSTCCQRVFEWPKSHLVEFWPKLAIWGHAVR